MSQIANYQEPEEEEDNWDDLVNNNDDIDDVLRTSIYSSRSTNTNDTNGSSRSRSPSKQQHQQQTKDNNLKNINNILLNNVKKKSYQSISLADFENAMLGSTIRATTNINNDNNHLDVKTVKVKSPSPESEIDDFQQIQQGNDTLILPKDHKLNQFMPELANNDEDDFDLDDLFDLSLNNDLRYRKLDHKNNNNNSSNNNNNKNYEDEQSDIEDGLEFPDDFDISNSNANNNDINKHAAGILYSNNNKNNNYRGHLPGSMMNYFKPPTKQLNQYSSTLELSPANLTISSSSNHHENSSNNLAASMYSESETDATDFYNDIEFENNNFEKLLEQRLRKARIQAELEEQEFYMMQQQKKNNINNNNKSLGRNKGKQFLQAKQNGIMMGASNVMNLPDDTAVYPYAEDEYGDEDDEDDKDNENEFLEDFEDFEEDLSFAIERNNQDIHKNVVVRNKPRLTTDAANARRIYNHQISSDLNLSKTKQQRSSPIKKQPQLMQQFHQNDDPAQSGSSHNNNFNRLMSKKSMPVLRSSSINPHQFTRLQNVRKASSAVFNNDSNAAAMMASNSVFKRNGKKKVLVQPMRRKQYGTGTELDQLDDLNVDYTKEQQTLLNLNNFNKGYGYNTATATLRDTITARNFMPISKQKKSAIDLRQYMESPPPSSRHSRSAGIVAGQKGILKKNYGKDREEKISNRMQKRSPSRSPLKDYDNAGTGYCGTINGSVVGSGNGNGSGQKSTKKRKHKIGLIKHLNAPQRQYAVEGYNGSKMVYNPRTYKWEGNEVDAKRFASIKPVRQPALITFLNKRGPYNSSHVDRNHNETVTGKIKPLKKKSRNKKGMKISSQDDSDFEELSMDGLQIEGNMYFNPRKLCWISLKSSNSNSGKGGDGNEEDSDSEEDPFKDINDLEVATTSSVASATSDDEYGNDDYDCAGVDIDNESPTLLRSTNHSNNNKNNTKIKKSDFAGLNHLFGSKLNLQQGYTENVDNYNLNNLRSSSNLPSTPLFASHFGNGPGHGHGVSNLDLPISGHYHHNNNVKNINERPTRGFSNMSRVSGFSEIMQQQQQSPTNSKKTPAQVQGGGGVASEFEVRDEFELSAETIHRFRMEEERWIKKVKSWFQPGDEDEEVDRDYMYEIRNMVMGGGSGGSA